MRFLSFKYSYKILVTYYDGFKFSKFKTKIFRDYDDYIDFCCSSDLTVVSSFFAVVDYDNELVCGVPIFSSSRESFEASVFPLLYNHGIKFSL